MSTSTTVGLKAGESLERSDKWNLRGACRGMEAAVFYPDPAIAEDTARALAVCASCDVREACRKHALAHREFVGIWGGTTGSERRRLFRRGQSV
ncbi:MAG: WhiB family transcriptional regulator [Acidimicrobiales bacterium]|nr:WhiB family transcriptional regulator [Acidimicrobiales bacterium]